MQQLAAAEVRRYLYHTTQDRTLAQVHDFSDVTNAGLPSDTRDSHPLSVWLLTKEKLQTSSDFGDIRRDMPSALTLKPQEYLIHQQAAQTPVYIVGGDSQGLLYGAYRFAEMRGVRFTLHGDVLPDRTAPGAQAGPFVHRQGATGPTFAVRGLQPFHDFFEGPDWWDVQMHKQVCRESQTGGCICRPPCCALLALWCVCWFTRMLGVQSSGAPSMRAMAWAARASAVTGGVRGGSAGCGTMTVPVGTGGGLVSRHLGVTLLLCQSLLVQSLLTMASG